jgi:hypothetical protein
MSDLCNVTPVSAFLSTNLNSKIECYQELGQRVLRMLGHPMINVELHPDQLYDAISMSCEFFTKYAGHTKEYLIFDSAIYEKNVGIRMDHLITVAKTGFTPAQKLAAPTTSSPDFNVALRENIYVAMSAIPYSFFVSSSALSSVIPSTGIPMLQVMQESTYAQLTAFNSGISRLFHLSPKESFSIQCESQPDATSFNNMFDYDVMDYRKVIDVVDFIEGSSSGVNTLFSLEQTLAQQTYFSYAMGNFGFDLLSWHTVKDWQDTREKLLATKRDVHFDNRTQYLRLMPQPKDSRFYGVFEVYVERPLRDIVKEKWVLDYSIALSKIMWGRILTKISGVQMLGGGTLNGGEVLAEGVAEKKELETFLIEGAYGDFAPISMFVS